jgi:hypothetical protein
VHPEARRQRSTVERSTNRLKQRCGLAPHYGKIVTVFKTALDVVAIRIWADRRFKGDDLPRRSALQ